MPVPGTDFYRYVEENNYLLTKDWSMYDPMKKPIFSYPGFLQIRLPYYSAYGLRKFYLRPKYILRRLRSIRYFHEFNGYVKYFFGFMRRYVIRKGSV